MEIKSVQYLLFTMVSFILSLGAEASNLSIANSFNNNSQSDIKNNAYDTLFLDGNIKFINQVNKSRIVYVIESSFDLKGKTVSLPEHSILLFRGGKICNGVLVGKKTDIVSSPLKIFENIKLEGSFINKLDARWFGVSPLNSDNSEYLKNALNSSSNNILEIPGGTYLFKQKVCCRVRNACIRGETYRSTTTTVFKYVSETPTKSNSSFSLLELKAFDLTIENIGIVSSHKDKELTAIEICDSILPGQIDSNIINCYMSNFGKCIVAHGRGIRVENNLFSNTYCCLHYIPAENQASTDIAQNPPYDGRGVIFGRNKCHGIDKVDEVFNGSAVVLGKNIYKHKVNYSIPSVLCMFICENEIDNTGSLLNSFLPIGDSVITGNILVKSISSAVTCSNGINGLIISNNIFGKYIATTSESPTTIISLGANADGLQNININNNILKDCAEEAISLKDKDTRKMEGIVVCNNIFSNVKYVLGSEGSNYKDIISSNNIYNLKEGGNFSKEK